MSTKDNCGDGTVQTTFGEECDGGNLNSTTCRDLGYFTGELVCLFSNCLFDESGCADIVSLSTSDFHACARRTDGTVRCWGDGTYGQLGQASFSGSTTAVPVSGLSGATYLTAGGNHTCAITGDIPMCWGRNAEFQLGDGSDIGSNVPKNLYGSPTGITRIEAGSVHSCMFNTGGHLAWCWGTNVYGQLGDNSTNSSAIPVIVSP